MSERDEIVDRVMGLELAARTSCAHSSGASSMPGRRRWPGARGYPAHLSLRGLGAERTSLSAQLTRWASRRDLPRRNRPAACIVVFTAADLDARPTARAYAHRQRGSL